MKKALLTVLVLCVLLALSSCAPAADQKDSSKEAQSAFVPAFDEIVVESSLTVRRKNDAGRQGRNKAAPATPKPVAASLAPASSRTEKARTKRASGFSGFTGFNKSPSWPAFSASASNAHAQSNNVHGPLGSFGASATHAQNQAFNVGPKGLTSTASLAATQHYYFPNGMKIDVNVAGGGAVVNGRPAHQSGASASSSSVIVTHPSGSQRIYN